MNKILTFTCNILNNSNLPSELKISLSPENINVNEQDDLLKNCIQLRYNRQIIKNTEHITRYTNLTFDYFF